LTEPNTTTENTKRKMDDDSTTTPTTTTKKQKVQSTSSPHTNDAKSKPQESQQPAWDPIQTVQTIITDIQKTPPNKQPTTENETNDQTTITHPQQQQAPSSRFVTRMIPIQITCYASMKEMRTTVRALLETKLLPVGLERRRQRQQLMEGGSAGDNEPLPTFRIDFRRRNCSNVKRAEVIDMVAGLVSELTEEALLGGEESGVDAGVDAGKDGSLSSSPPQLFTVNLKDAEYTVLIEVCQTLCGMSVIPNVDAFHNFNLIVMREKAEEEV